jgi:hypothetical protein
MNELLSGAIALGLVVISMFFHKFWRKTGDRFFGLFSLAFIALAITRVALALLDEANEERDYLYLLRLGSFLIILVAIVDKNRKQP